MHGKKRKCFAAIWFNKHSGMSSTDIYASVCPSARNNWIIP